MTDTPMYDETLSDLLLRARRHVDAAQARAALAERNAAQRAADLEHEARLRIAAGEREVRLRLAALDHQAATEADLQAREDRVRAAVTAAAAVPIERRTLQLVDPVPPAVPSMADLMQERPSRFLDSLLGDRD